MPLCLSFSSPGLGLLLAVAAVAMFALSLSLAWISIFDSSAAAPYSALGGSAVPAVVSFTTIPARLAGVTEMLASLGAQVRGKGGRGEEGGGK